MILTLTPNPSVDVHLHVEGPLEPHGELNRADRVEKLMGGKGIQVARALAREKVSCVAMAWCGRESMATVQRLLLRESFAHQLVPVPGEIRRNVHLYATHPDSPWKVNEAGPELTREDIETCLDVYTQSMDKGPAMVALCGTLPRGVSADVMARLVTLARERDIAVAVDTSGEALRAAAARSPTLLKVNREELAGMLGREVSDDDLAAAALESHDRGIARVVVTNGSRPGIAVDHDGTVWQFPVPRITPRTTVGAGDNFLAGLLAAGARGEDFPAMLHHAVATSATHCLGGEPCPDFPMPVAVTV